MNILSKFMDNMGKFKLQWAMLAIFLSLLIIFMITSPQTFLSRGIYISLMSTIPFAGLMALAFTFVVVSGEIDLSFPSVMAVSGFVFAVVFTSTGSIGLALVCSLAMGAAAGLLNGILITKVGLPSFVATIGGFFLWRGVAKVSADYSGEAMTKVIGGTEGTIISDVLTWKIGGVIPAQFLWFILVAVCLWLLFSRHRFGDSIRFAGDNEDKARILGIEVDRIRIFAFVMLGLMCALSAVISDLYLNSWFPTQGMGLFLPVFAMVFIGGTPMTGGGGTIFGTFIGVLIISMLNTGIVTAGFSGYWIKLVLGLVLIVSISVQVILRRR